MDDKTFLEGDHDAFMGALDEQQTDWMNNHEYTPGPVDCQLFINRYDVTDFFVKAVWSGTITEVGRKLDLTVLDDQGYYTPKLEIEMHDLVQFFVNGDEIFRGYVMQFDRTTHEKTVNYTCYDKGIFLTKSKAKYKFFDTPPEKVVTQVCKDMDIPVAKLEPGEPYQRIHDNDSIYDIIMTGYTITSKSNGKQYYMRFDKGALSILLKGDKVYKYLLSSEHDLTKSTYSQSTLNSINQVKCYDADGQETATIKLESEKDFPGILQAVHNAESGGDADKDAKSMLKEKERKASIEGFGAMECTTGNAVVVEDMKTKLDGLFYIEADSHTFADGHHMMSLDINFENIMHQVMAGQEKEESEADAAVGGGEGYTTEQQIWNMLRALGFSAAATAGIMGNMEAESGCRPNITEVNGYAGYGLCQWTFGRKPKLMNWCKNNGLDYTTVEGQVKFMYHEWQEPYYQKFLSDFKNETDVWRATDRWLTYFEGCTVRTEDVHWDRRLNSAKKYYNQWKNYVKIPLPKSTSGDGDGKYTGSMGWPFAGGAGTVTQGFTWNGYSGHLGVDISTSPGYGAGSPVLAVDGGVVVSCGNGVSDWSYGNEVNIKHSSNTYTRYAHLSSICVHVGQKVSKGQKIGVEGNTGNSYGTHLHFEVNSGIPNGTRRNPLNYIHR